MTLKKLKKAIKTYEMVDMITQVGKTLLQFQQIQQCSKQHDTK